MTLSTLGWSRWHADHLGAPLAPEETLRRVAVAHTDRADLLPTGCVFQPKLPENRLQVGDWVVVSGERLVRRLPRRTTLARRAVGGGPPQVVATNLDTVFLVTSLNRDFNPRRLERYLAVVHAGGATPVVVLTKSDLALGQEGRFLRQVPPGVDVLVTSAALDLGLDEVRAHLAPGRTVCFVGSSGAGKSTLVNALVGAEVMPTGEVREDDARGRHTTTRRELLVFDLGVLIDTPGMRELGLVDADGLDAVFEDVVEAATRCRYRDCAHEGEDGCAVEAEVAPERLASWRKLQREAAFEARRGDDRLRRDEERRWKRIAKAHRARTKALKQRRG